MKIASKLGIGESSVRRILQQYTESTLQIEKALDELTIDYDVLFSDDVLKESKSWDKGIDCRIYKLHGDFNSGKIRNTLSELKELDPLIADDFQYIIDRHGVIIIGYSGRDYAIMQYFKSRKPHYYPMYWHHYLS